MNEKLEGTEERSAASGGFSVKRAAFFAVAVSVFLIVFQPFEISIDSFAKVLILVGVAPLSFLSMFCIHRLPMAAGVVRTITGVLVLVIVNSLYLAIWSETGMYFGLMIKVALVVGLIMIVIGFWSLERTRYQAASDTRAHHQGPQQVVLRGQNEREVLQLESRALLCLSASGNYVDVHYDRNGEPAKTLLRASMSGLVSQLDGVQLLQCHRSYFVNKLAIQRIISKRGRLEIELRLGLRIPVSRTYKDAVLASVSD